MQNIISRLETRRSRSHGFLHFKFLCSNANCYCGTFPHFPTKQYQLNVLPCPFPSLLPRAHNHSSHFVLLPPSHSMSTSPTRASLPLSHPVSLSLTGTPLPPSTPLPRSHPISHFLCPIPSRDLSQTVHLPTSIPPHVPLPLAHLVPLSVIPCLPDPSTPVIS